MLLSTLAVAVDVTVNSTTTAARVRCSSWSKAAAGNVVGAEGKQGLAQEGRLVQSCCC